MIDPWQHQSFAVLFAESKRGAGIFAGVGLGKTRIAIDLLRKWECRKVLIIGPKAGLDVWVDQLPRWDSQLTPIITPRKLSVEKRFARALQEIRALNGKPWALIINYEAIWREPFHAWLMAIGWDCIVADEAHKLKTPGGKQSRFASQLGKHAKRRLALTGTPMAQSPLDVYALYRFLDPAVFGTSFAVFKSEYAVMDPVFPGRVLTYRQMDKFKEKFDSIAYSVNAERAGVWLPEHIDIERTCELNPESRRIYDELEEQFCTGIGDGTITPDNAAVQLLRLQQITSGHIRDDARRLIDLDAPKSELLAAVLEELAPSEPVVVFCRFRPDLDLVHRVAAELGRASGELSGERNDLAAWQAGEQLEQGNRRISSEQSRIYSKPISAINGQFARGVPNPDGRSLGETSRNAKQSSEFLGDNRSGTRAGPVILAVQIQAGSAAVDLSRARYAIYYSVGYSLLDYEQSRGRIKRPNSTHRSVFYVHLIAKNTVDRRVYRALKARKQVIDDIMADVKRGERLDGERGELDVDPNTGEIVRGTV